MTDSSIICIKFSDIIVLCFFLFNSNESFCNILVMTGDCGFTGALILTAFNIDCTIWMHQQDFRAV